MKILREIKQARGATRTAGRLSRRVTRRIEAPAKMFDFLDGLPPEPWINIEISCCGKLSTVDDGCLKSINNRS